MEILQETRKSHIELDTPYFWTATIHNWKNLLADDAMKMEIIQSLKWLKERNLIDVYAYVIMPNHLHLIWKVKSKNGKESSQGSFLKFTAHRFRRILDQTNQQTLKEFEVLASNKAHEFWQRDSLAIPLYNRHFLLQKITYIHNNPIAKHWRLAASPTAYRFSSAAFYQNGKDEFEILTHIGNIF
jgi:REP element-mobilizing transposase RayT